MRLPLAALALALVSACLDDPDLATDEAALVGGATTAVRPEIGQYGSGSGWCTATLVRPQVVLTAAHCLAPAFTATAPMPDAIFAFVDATGTSDARAIDRVHSFSTNRNDMLWWNEWGTDVALLHLALPIGPAQAVPAALALQEPNPGDLSTTFGFGCTDRTPWSGGGSKQALTFRYRDATHALCSGDSGGPVVFGAVAGGGAIWGVNSDWNAAWDIGGLFPDTWTDLFANVPFYRKQIEDVIRTWEGPDEQGVNRPGLDYTNLVATPAACRAACQADGACRAFTWVPEGASGRCWLKSGAPEPVPGPGLISGLPTRLEPQTNRAGGDYAVSWQPDADACAAQCGREAQCQAFTYAGTSCWRKGSVPAASACATCTSGVPRRGYELAIDRPGFDVATHTAASAAACATLCAQNDRCEAYTFTGAPSSNCWLKDAVAPARGAAGMTSGVRRGLETSTFRWGGDYRSFFIGSSPAICQAECARDAACLSWTYGPPPASGGQAGCFLLRTVAPRHPGNPGWVAGVKGAEFLP